MHQRQLMNSPCEWHLPESQSNEPNLSGGAPLASPSPPSFTIMVSSISALPNDDEDDAIQLVEAPSHYWPSYPLYSSAPGRQCNLRSPPSSIISKGQSCIFVSSQQRSFPSMPYRTSDNFHASGKHLSRHKHRSCHQQASSNWRPILVQMQLVFLLFSVVLISRTACAIVPSDKIVNHSVSVFASTLVPSHKGANSSTSTLSHQYSTINYSIVPTHLRAIPHSASLDREYNSIWPSEEVITTQTTLVLDEDSLFPIGASRDFVCKVCQCPEIKEDFIELDCRYRPTDEKPNKITRIPFLSGLDARLKIVEM